jgi:hypothetical protein
VKTPNESEERAITELFEQYAETLKLRSRFSLPDFMGDAANKEIEAVGAILETTDVSYVYSTKSKVGQRPLLPPNVQVQVPPGGSIPLTQFAQRQYDLGVQSLGWRANDEGL